MLFISMIIDKKSHKQYLSQNFKKLKSNLLYIAVAAFLFSACGGDNDNVKAGPITLGDSTTIVTETDAKYLKDDVSDLEPERRKASETTTTATPPAAEKPKEEAPVAAAPPTKQNVVSGYTIAFGNIKIVFEGITANDANRQNPEKQEALSYMIKSGNIAASKIHIYGAKDATLKQRYQTKLQLSSPLGTVDLRNLGLYTSAWKDNAGSQSGGAPTFNLNDLSKLSYNTVNNNKIKNATDRELRKRHTNRSTIQSWMKEISRTRSASDEPCRIELDNLQLQISGTGADGKPFRKRIRMNA